MWWFKRGHSRLSVHLCVECASVRGGPTADGHLPGTGNEHAGDGFDRAGADMAEW